MSASSIAAVFSNSVAVPRGPNTDRGLGANDNTQRIVKMSFRSVMWSLWRWVRYTPRNAPTPDPTAAARMRTPRPQSKSRSPASVRTSVEGPARCASGRGLPLPRMITCMVLLTSACEDARAGRRVLDVPPLLARRPAATISVRPWRPKAGGPSPAELRLVDLRCRSGGLHVNPFADAAADTEDCQATSCRCVKPRAFSKATARSHGDWVLRPRERRPSTRVRFAVARTCSIRSVRSIRRRVSFQRARRSPVKPR